MQIANHVWDSTSIAYFGNDATVNPYLADIKQSSDYSPFGVTLEGRNMGPTPAQQETVLVEEPVQYTGLYGTVVNTDGDLELSTSSVPASANNSANSVQTVMAGEYIEWIASPDTLPTNRTFVGLSFVNGGNTYLSIQYSWYMYPNGASYVYESGTQMYANYTAFVPGVTTFRIARTGGNIVYYRNGAAVRTVTDPDPASSMIVDITMFNTGYINKVYDLRVAKFQVMTLENAIYSNLSPSTTVDADGNLNKVPPNGGWGHAGASCEQQILAGEYIKFEAGSEGSSFNSSVFVGLSYSSDPDYNYTSIDYAWYLYLAGMSNTMWENGVSAGAPAGNSTFTAGTQFMIARFNGKIIYYRNGVAVRTVTDANPTTPMVVDISMIYPDTKVYNLKIGKLMRRTDYAYGYQGSESDNGTATFNRTLS